MAKEFDLVVRGGTVADGRGGTTYEADVAVSGGKIAAVGTFSGSGTEEIDAKGLLVTPGFTDIHTHYDGQITWENRLAPSSNHGVTTVVMGNCAVGFAPCRPEQRELLIKLMEGVEDIPDVVMAEGIPWKWESFPEYLDFLATRQSDMDFAAQVPHAPVRVFVMGQRAADREPAKDDDMRAMTKVVQDGIAAGALGFTTSRTMNHRTRAGSLAPTVTAAEEELRAIALGLKEIGQGVLQMVDDFHATTAEDSAEFDMWRRIAQVSGRPLSFNLVQDNAAPDRWRYLLDFISKANQAGVRVKGQTPSRAIGSLFGLELSEHPFAFSPTYLALAKLPLAERVAEMRKPEVKAKILVEGPVSLAQQKRLASPRTADNMFEFTNPPNYEPSADQRLGVRAARMGIPSIELAYDLLLEQDGHNLLYFANANYSYNSLDVVLEMLKHQHTVMGLSDGGAHVVRMCDASQPTHMLAYWTRDRAGEKLPLGTAVRKLARDTAATVGLNDRGIVAPGYKADLNVIDYDRLSLEFPHLLHDLPAGGRRLNQRANGYVATVKAGTVTYRNGEATGALPGRLVRGQQADPATAR